MEERLISLIRLAIKNGATDIHFSFKGEEGTITARIDGNFKKIKTCYGDHRLIRYMRYLSGVPAFVINTEEPQAGTFEMIIDRKIVALRFSSICTDRFSDGVLRLLSVG